MSTFRDNKQALYDIFQYVLTNINPLHYSVIITEEKYLIIVTQ